MKKKQFNLCKFEKFLKSLLAYRMAHPYTGKPEIVFCQRIPART